ncbi:hypothetical protein FRC01_000173 [Tulasnella sp. 417]|nr:hypothetical protein FRC01_000173 [Tulasnella sp. 417]
MHFFWEVPELVSEVISLLPRQDQARLARVNSRVWEIAIPHIWSDVPNIQYLFKLFPHDLWNNVEEPTTSPPLLNRELQGSDWSRLLVHSQNTKTIYYTSRELRDVVPTEILCHSLVASAFPLLERLVVNVFGDSGDQVPINITPLLLRPSLRSIEFSTDSADFGSPLINTLQSIAENKTPLLEELILPLTVNVNSVGGVGEKAIASQRCLRRLTITSISDIAGLTESARDLPLLEELEVADSRVISDPPTPNYNLRGFRSLTTLIATGVPDTVHTLLRSIRSDRLVRVALTPINFLAPIVPSGFPAELQRFQPRLVHLQITMHWSFSWANLAPLLNLAELQTFDLNYFDSYLITDDMVRQMVDAWPNLVRLRLKAANFTSLLTFLTLQSLAYIAAQCPNLMKMAISFEGQKAKNSFFPSEIDISHFSKNALELFDVTVSMFDEGGEERLAKIFRSWWPKARLCRSDPSMTSTTRWDIEEAPSWPRQWSNH